MSYKYGCPNCKQEIVVQHCEPGDKATCRSCRRESVVPRDAVQVAGNSGTGTEVNESGPAATQDDPIKLIEAVEKRLLELEVGKNSPLKGLIYLALSILMFVGVFSVTNNAENIVLILVVLLIHELGHVAGMTIFGYKNVQMLFVPALGAVVTGRATEPDGAKSAIVALMGPAPGILLGAVAGFVSLNTGHDLVVQYAKTSLFLNAFNLLPLFPLDGGRILQSTLFGAYPRARWVFQLLTCLVMAGIAVFLKSYVMGFFAFMVLLSISGAAGEARLVSALRRKIAGNSDARESRVIPREYLADILSGLRDLVKGGFSEESKKVASAAQRIWDATREKIPSKTEVVGISFMYVLVLTFGVGAIFHVNRLGGDRELAVAVAAVNAGEYVEAIAATDTVLATHPGNCDALELKAVSQFRLGEYAKASETANSVLRVDSTRVSALLVKARSLLALEQFEDAAPYFLRVISQQPDRPASYSFMADMRLKQGKFKDALEYAKKAHELAPEKPGFTASLATCYHLNGQIAEGDSMLKLARKQGYFDNGELDSLVKRVPDRQSDSSSHM